MAQTSALLRTGALAVEKGGVHIPPLRLHEVAFSSPLPTASYSPLPAKDEDVFVDSHNEWAMVKEARATRRKQILLENPAMQHALTDRPVMPPLRLPPAPVGITGATSFGATSALPSIPFLQAGSTKMSSTSSVWASGVSPFRIRGRKRGVAIRLAKLAREETIPDIATGKRSRAARDLLIRVYLRVPGHCRIAFWVPQDFQVGPTPNPPRNRFTDYWGLDAEAKGPFSARPASPSTRAGRLTPVRALMAQQDGAGLWPPFTKSTDTRAGRKSIGVASIGDLSKAATSRTSTTTRSFRNQYFGNLKALIEASTGVPVERQKLVYGLTGVLRDDAKTLPDYDIGHGSLLLLSVMPASHQKNKKDIKYLSGPKLAQEASKGHIMARITEFIQARLKSNKGYDLVEILPDWKNDHPPPLNLEESHTYECYQEYDWVPESHQSLSAMIRKRFYHPPKVPMVRAETPDSD